MRRLTVAGARWCWRVKRDGPPYPGHVIVRVWREGAGGNAAKLDVRVRFDDPWLNYGPIITAPPERVAEVFALAPVTPRLVAAAIEQAIAGGWDAGARGTIASARWEGERLVME